MSLTGGRMMAAMKTPRALALAILALALVSGCGTVSPLSPPAAIASPVAPPCEQTNAPGQVSNVKLQEVSGWSPGLVVPFAGIVASGSLFWDGCEPTTITPSDLILETSSGIVKCGDEAASAGLAAEYGAAAYPVHLDPKETLPIVVGFAGPVIAGETFTVYVGLPARFAHCP